MPPDLVIWSGDPFKFSTNAQHLFIHGHRGACVVVAGHLIDRPLQVHRRTLTSLER
jgi:hypothetical protein